MVRIPIGSRIREMRKEKGLTQQALARAVSVSAAYLNLIEHDRRSIGGALLKRIAETLDVDLSRLSGFDDGQLAHDVLESARSLSLPGLDETTAGVFVMRSPEWAAAFRALHRRYQDATDAAHGLSDRLSQDPQLMELSHALLTQITSVRAFAEILEDFADIGPAERLRFSGIIASQSDQLGSTARAMMGLLQGGPAAPRPMSPLNEVEDLIIHRGNYFAELEEEALRLRRRLPSRSGSIAASIADRLAEGHEIVVRRGQHCNPAGTEPERGVLLVDEWASEATWRFATARCLAEIEFSELLDALVADSRLTSDEARRQARRALASYAAGSLLFPYDEFLAAAEADRYDLERLGIRFGGSLEQIAHRLVTLRQPGAEGVPFAFLRCDPAGNLSKPFSIPGLRMPRLGGACPLWALYNAFAAPESMVSQMAVMPQGERFLFFARRITKRSAGHGSTPKIFSIMLGCEAAYMDRLVYGDSFATDRSSQETHVGVNCRSCPREHCPQRAYPLVIPSHRP